MDDRLCKGHPSRDVPIADAPSQVGGGQPRGRLPNWPRQLNRGRLNLYGIDFASSLGGCGFKSSTRSYKRVKKWI